MIPRPVFGYSPRRGDRNGLALEDVLRIVGLYPLFYNIMKTYSTGVFFLSFLVLYMMLMETVIDNKFRKVIDVLSEIVAIGFFVWNIVGYMILIVGGYA